MTNKNHPPTRTIRNRTRTALTYSVHPQACISWATSPPGCRTASASASSPKVDQSCLRKWMGGGRRGGGCQAVCGSTDAQVRAPVGGAGGTLSGPLVSVRVSHGIEATASAIFLPEDPHSRFTYSVRCAGPTSAANDTAGGDCRYVTLPCWVPQSPQVAGSLGGGVPLPAGAAGNPALANCRRRWPHGGGAPAWLRASSGHRPYCYCIPLSQIEETGIVGQS